jgi:hypothetical protein
MPEEAAPRSRRECFSALPEVGLVPRNVVWTRVAPIAAEEVHVDLSPGGHPNLASYGWLRAVARQDLKVIVHEDPLSGLDLGVEPVRAADRRLPRPTQGLGHPLCGLLPPQGGRRGSVRRCVGSCRPMVGGAGPRNVVWTRAALTEAEEVRVDLDPAGDPNWASFGWLRAATRQDLKGRRSRRSAEWAGPRS